MDAGLINPKQAPEDMYQGGIWMPMTVLMVMISTKGLIGYIKE
jgi:hypothetical protein